MLHVVFGWSQGEMGVRGGKGIYFLGVKFSSQSKRHSRLFFWMRVYKIGHFATWMGLGMWVIVLGSFKGWVLFSGKKIVAGLSKALFVDKMGILERLYLFI